MSLYRKIMRQAWNIAWNNKYLWFFGLFSLILLDNNFEYLQLIDGLKGRFGQNFITFIEQYRETGIFNSFFANLWTILTTQPASFLIALFFILIFLVLIAFLLWLVIISQAALVNNVSLAASEQENNIKTGVLAGIKHFWATLSYVVINKLAAIILIATLSLPAVFGWFSDLFSPLYYICSIIIFAGVYISISFTLKYALAFKILRDNKFSESLKNGYYLFKENWAVSIEMGLTLLFIGVVASFAILLFANLVAFQFKSLAVYTIEVTGSSGLSWSIFIFSNLISLAILTIGAALYSVFQISSWTNLYSELLSKGGVSKVSRIIRSFKK